MKVSELIVKLKELKEIHGDLEVLVTNVVDFDGSTEEQPAAAFYVHEPLTHERYFRIS